MSDYLRRLLFVWVWGVFAWGAGLEFAAQIQPSRAAVTNDAVGLSLAGLQALSQTDQTGNRPSSETTAVRVIQPGNRGRAIAQIQYMLKGLQLYDGEVDGFYGEETEAAVREFQRSHALSPTGTVNRETWDRLVTSFQAVAERRASTDPSTGASAEPDSESPEDSSLDDTTSAPTPAAPILESESDIPSSSAPNPELESTPNPASDPGSQSAAESPSSPSPSEVTSESEQSAAYIPWLQLSVLMLSIAAAAYALGRMSVATSLRFNRMRKLKGRSPSDLDSGSSNSVEPDSTDPDASESEAQAFNSQHANSKLEAEPQKFPTEPIVPSTNGRLGNGHAATEEAEPDESDVAASVGPVKGAIPDVAIANSTHEPASSVAVAADMASTEASSSLIADEADINPTTRMVKVDLIETLIHELQSPDPTVRRKAIWELGQKGTTEAIQPLVDLMIDVDSQQRSLILAAISEIGVRTLKPLSRALITSLQDTSSDVRKNAIRDVSRVYELMAHISVVLRHATDDEDDEVRETACWALNQLNRLRTPPTLERQHQAPDSLTSSDP